MKRLISVVFALLIAWCSSAIAETNVYGTFKILGIGGQTTDPYVVVFASYVGGNDGWQLQYCAQQNWWWPAGTTHTWWIDRNDMTTFAIFLAASRTQSKVFISGYVDPKWYGQCRIWQIATGR